eukprot:1115664-Prymnesium_polylepis.1
MTSNSGGDGAPIDILVVKHKQTTALSAHRNRHEHRPLAPPHPARPQAARPHSCSYAITYHIPSATAKCVYCVCTRGGGGSSSG